MSDGDKTIERGPVADAASFTVPDWWPRPANQPKQKPARQRTNWRKHLDLAHHITNQLSAGRFIIALATSYAVGIIAFFQAGQDPNLALSIAITLALSALTFLARNNFSLARTCLMFAVLACGFTAPQVKAHLTGTPMLASEINLPLTGKVRAIRTNSAGRKTLFLSQLSTPYRLNEPLPRIARLTLLKSPETQPFAVGDTVSLFARLSPVPKPVLPHSYDSQVQSYFSGIGAFGLIFGEVTRTQPAATSSISAKLASLRTTITKSIHLALPYDSGAIATAMLVGDQSGITKEIRTKMQVSGLAHILAISGLHMSLVAGGLYFLLRALFATSHTLTLLINTRALAATLAIPAAFAYLAISGAGIATLRATIMATIVFIAILAGRRALTMRNVAVAMIIVLSLYPQSILSAGFQLSFAAVIGLVGVYEMHRRGGFDRENSDRSHTRLARLARYARALFLTSLTAGLATSFFAAYHFNQLSPLGVFANMFGMPLVAFLIMPAGIAAFLAMPLGFAEIPLRLMGWGIDRLLDIAEFFAAKTSTFAYVAPLDPIIFPITIGCLIWFAFFKSNLRWLAPIIAFAAIPTLGKAPMPDLIIADRGTSAAINGENGLQMIASRRSSFTLDRWSQTYNVDLNKQPRIGTCDPLACTYQSPKGYSVTLVKKRAAFNEECRTADIIISKLPAPTGCAAHARLIADGPFLTKSGTLLVFWDTHRQSPTILSTITNQHRRWRPAY